VLACRCDLAFRPGQVFALLAEILDTVRDGALVLVSDLVGVVDRREERSDALVPVVEEISDRGLGQEVRLR